MQCIVTMTLTVRFKCDVLCIGQKLSQLVSTRVNISGRLKVLKLFKEILRQLMKSLTLRSLTV